MISDCTMTRHIQYLREQSASSTFYSLNADNSEQCHIPKIYTDTGTTMAYSFTRRGFRTNGFSCSSVDMDSHESH
ncbi:hypothetical protein RB195_021965 [Necator americanus]|uniref:Uncharacterized protein n=1 Tax=Necator americanus TaxID=51031 RepID=A0ABR1EG42_NECAM